jgi:uncharacterized Fe-S center protein
MKKKTRESKVYMIALRSSMEDTVIDRLAKGLKKAGFGSLAGEKELLAIKMHFGERGCTSYIRPIYVRTVIDAIRPSGCLPFLTDTNTLYVGSRSNTVDHIKTAIENGYSYASIGIPIVIADGLKGGNFETVQIEGKLFNEVRIASDIARADAMVVLTHVKGHELTGIGGTLKSAGMGCGSRAGKLEMHSDVRPRVSEACIGCAKCVSWCPVAAIKVKAKKAAISSEVCIGCSECIVVCPVRAIKINWEWDARFVQERMVEYAVGALKPKGKKAAYVNFVMDVSPQCDCYGFSDASIVPDVGILISRDPVAIDKASVDLINKQEGIPHTAVKSRKPGSDKLRDVHPEVDWQIQIRHAEKMGLGTSRYRLITI